MNNSKIAQKILIVEDDAALLFALSFKLTSKGFNVLQARNGAKGLNLAILERPDLILLDFLMPIMDGQTMMNELRTKDDWSKKVPIIFLSNIIMDKKKNEANTEENENTYYLLKVNLNMAQIVEKVNEILSQK